VANFANADMIGHTGNFAATKKSIEIMDKAIGKIVKKFPGTIIITADHGNSEDMASDCSTCHSTNKVPLIIVNQKGKLKKGGLADVAPTLLKIMKIKKPKVMAGNNLLR